MADRVLLSNDATVGYTNDDRIATLNLLANETSAHGASAGNVQFFGPLPVNGRIVDFAIGVLQPALSASGFVSGTVNATLRINSATVCSTDPVLTMVATSATCIRQATNQSAANATSAVVNNLSANFSAGDMISIDWNARSVGSAAAGAAGKGLYAMVRYRLAAA